MDVGMEHFETAISQSLAIFFSPLPALSLQSEGYKMGKRHWLLWGSSDPLGVMFLAYVLEYF